jgi:antitoxin YefM
MDIISFAEARLSLSTLMHKVVRDHTPVAVSLKHSEAVVMISLADWNATEDTIHLLSQRTNASRLSEAIAELDTGSIHHKPTGP